MDDYPCLYHLTVRRPDAITSAVFCSFNENTESLVVARGQWLEVLELDSNENLVLLARMNLFAAIRCIDTIHTPGTSKGMLVVLTDSGYLSVLEFSYKSHKFSVFSSEKVAIAKLRHEFPGEYLVVDPSSRICVVAGIERLRSVLVFHNEGIITPAIDVFMPSTFYYSIIALNRGDQNPAFACLERFRFSKKVLTVYEFNLGLNSANKVWSREVAEDCNVVTAISLGRDGPSGLMVFANSKAEYWDCKMGEMKTTIDLQLKNEFIIYASTITFDDSAVFVLACTSIGRVISVQIESVDEPEAIRMISSVLEVEPQPLVKSIAFSKSGLMFFNFETDSHKLFQVTQRNHTLKLDEVDELMNLSPVTSSFLQSRQLLLGRGSNPSSAGLARVYPGLQADELASTPLPGTPTVICTAKSSFYDKFDKFIVIGFSDGTTTSLVIGDEGAIEEAPETETGIASDQQTLGIAQLISGFVQIHSKGFRYITGTSMEKVNPWLAPTNTNIKTYAFTPTQVILALANKTVIYFEEKDGNLLESQHRLGLNAQITAVCFASLQSNEIKSTRLFVALDDETLREYNVPNLKQKKIIKLSYEVTSVVHCMKNKCSTSSEYFCIGHKNGAYSEIDHGETIVRVLGSSPVMLIPLSGNNIIALSSRAWLHKNQNIVPLTGTSVKGLKACHRFTTEDLPEGHVIGIKGSSLEVFSINDDKERLHSVVELGDPFGGICTSSGIVKNSYSGNVYAMLRSGSISITRNSLEWVSLHHIRDTSESILASVNVKFDSYNEEYLAISLGDKIAVYRYLNTESLELVHETPMPNKCMALLPFNGKIVAAVGSVLILYEIGQKQLLRKGGITLNEMSCIKTLRASQNMIYVGTSHHSVSVISVDNKGDFHLVANDRVPRSATCMVLLDIYTVCIGDRYGNLTILKLSFLENIGVVPQSPVSMHCIAQFRVPDAIVGLHRGSLLPLAGNEAIIYVGLQGTIGVLIPFVSQSEYDTIWELQNNFYAGLPESIVHRDVVDFRGYYTPIRNIIDGDYLEYAIMHINDDGTKLVDQVAENLDTSPVVIHNRLKNIRYRSVPHTMSKSAN